MRPTTTFSRASSEVGVARVADAAVVGSALVDEVEAALKRNESPVRKVLETAHALAQAVRQARVTKASV